MRLLVDIYDAKHQECGDAVIWADKGELMITVEAPNGGDLTMLLSDFHRQGYYMERPRIA